MYFVVEKDRVVALDISEALREYRENAAVHVFETVQKARNGVLSLGNPQAAVVSLWSLSEIEPEELSAIGEISQHVVLIVDSEESLAALPPNCIPNCIIVVRPFGSSTLAGALLRLSSD